MAFVLWPAVAAADYDVPAGCPEQATFTDAVARRVEEPPRDWKVRVVREEERYLGALSWRGRTRRIQADDCDALIDALALSLTLQITASAPAAPAPPSPPPPSSLPLGPSSPSHLRPSARPPSPRPPPSAPEPPLPWSWQLGLGIAGAVVSGRAPSVRAEVEIEVSLRRGDEGYVPAAGLGVFTFNSGELVRGGRGTASLRMFGGRLHLCPAGWRWGAITLLGCGDVELARVEADGRLDTAERARSIWLALGGQLRVGWRPISPLEIALSAGATAPLARYRVKFEEPETVIYTAASVGMRGALALTALLP